MVLFCSFGFSLLLSAWPCILLLISVFDFVFDLSLDCSSGFFIYVLCLVCWSGVGIFHLCLVSGFLGVEREDYGVENRGLVCWSGEGRLCCRKQKRRAEKVLKFYFIIQIYRWKIEIYGCYVSTFC